MIDKHTIALISITGCSLDLLGAMYLAYDLLGGEHGPLRTLTRAVTYGGLFGVGFGLGLGPIFGLASGVTTGVTLGWEFSRAAKHRPKPGFWYDVIRSRNVLANSVWPYCQLGRTFPAGLCILCISHRLRPSTSIICCNRTQASRSTSARLRLATMEKKSRCANFEKLWAIKSRIFGF